MSNTKQAIIDQFPALEKLFNEDYDKWVGLALGGNRQPYAISFEIGPKYTRIVQNGSGNSRSTCGFVAMVDAEVTRMGSKSKAKLTLKAGDLLKAAGWKAPALNFTRGNIFDLENSKDHIRWTGIN